MMKRIRSDIYRERNEKVKLAKEAARKAKNLLNDSDYKNLEGVEHNELERLRESLRKHYEKRIQWLEQKTLRTHSNKMRSDVINGVNMKDMDLPDTFESIPRVYGGVNLDKNEIDLLNLSPKFAVLNKLSELELTAEVDK